METTSFEARMARLEEITKQLERGDIPLEESLKIFEEGTALIQTCKQMLDGAEQKVRLLVRGTTDEMVPFGDADSSDSEKAAEETNETEQ